MPTQARPGILLKRDQGFDVGGADGVGRRLVRFDAIDHACKGSGVTLAHDIDHQFRLAMKHRRRQPEVFPHVRCHQ